MLKQEFFELVFEGIVSRDECVILSRMTDKRMSMLFPYHKFLRFYVVVVVLSFGILSYFFLDVRFSQFCSEHLQSLLPICLCVQYVFNGVFVLPLVVLLLLLSFVIPSLKAWRSWLLALLLCLIVGQIFLFVVKVMVGRARPYVVLQQGFQSFSPYHLSRDYFSFPSGHTLNIMMIAGLLGLRYSSQCGAILGLGLLLSFFRVIGIQHFFSDWLLTAYLSLVFIAIVSKIVNRYQHWSMVKMIQLGFKERA